MTATLVSATTVPCPESQEARHARPQGVHRLVLIFGMALAGWAQERADRKALARTRHPLSALSDHERVTLYREATELRESAYASRSSWHVTG